VGVDLLPLSARGSIASFLYIQVKQGDHCAVATYSGVMHHDTWIDLSISNWLGRSRD
jgi:hypothetical protein